MYYQLFCRTPQADFIKVAADTAGGLCRHDSQKRNYYNFILNIYLLNIGYNLNLDHKCSSFGSRRRRASPYTNTERYLLGKRTGVRSKALQIFQFTKLIFEKIYLFRYILNNLYMLIK